MSCSEAVGIAATSLLVSLLVVGLAVQGATEAGVGRMAQELTAVRASENGSVTK